MAIFMSNEDFQAVKTVLREQGYLPNKKLVLEFYEKALKQIDGLTFDQFDEHSEEERKQLINDQADHLQHILSMMSSYRNFI